MNAGLKSWEVFNYIDSIKTKDGYIKKEDVDFSYRETKIDTIVYEVVFNIEYGFSNEMLKEFTKMRDNQPSVASAGSCFKNPKGDFAGRLIESVGLKGIKKGDMSFSELHANFLVNCGNGTFDDAIYLIDLAKQKIKDEFNIDIEEEIIIYK
jgi:UDP-N-acetylmuramate dehydrogenase